MNILFVFTVKDHRYRPGHPTIQHWRTQFGISCISAVLKEAGHNTELLICCGNTLDSEIDAVLARFKPSLICFTAVYSEYSFTASLASRLRKRNPVPLLLVGGVHATLNPDEVIKDCWDALCIGEGEYAVRELVARLCRGESIVGVPGIWVKMPQGEVHKTSPSRFIEDISELPPPDREMWNPWAESNPKMMTILLGRGCPFECTYCCNHKLKTVAHGRYVRIRRCDDVMREVSSVLTSYPSVRQIYFEIETIGIHETSMFELAAALGRLNRDRRNTNKPGITFHANLRLIPNHDFEPLLFALRRAGFAGVNIGIESGCEAVRKQHLKRIYSNDDVYKAVSSARRARLFVLVFVLVGIPGESIQDFHETVELLRNIQPEFMASYIVFPYPGTEMEKRAREQELLSGHITMKQERFRATMDLPGFSKRQIERAFDWLPYDVYKGHRPLAKLLLEVLMRKITRLGWFGLKGY